MIMIIDWPTFQTHYLKTANTIFVREDDSFWEVYTHDGKFYIKSVVEKSENQEENMMFIERYFQGRESIIKVMEVLENDILPASEEVSDTESHDAIRDEDIKEVEPELTDEERASLKEIENTEKQKLEVENELGF